MRATRRGALAIPILFAVLVGCAASSAALAAPEDWDWNYNAILGRRIVGSKEWKPFRDYGEVGVEASWGKSDEPLMFATDFFASQDTKREGNRTLASNSYQVQLGLRKIWSKTRWNPYAGAGIAFTKTDAERPTLTGGVESSDDITEGLWVGGGIFYRAGTNLNLGVALRASLMRRYRIFGLGRGGNSTHIGFVIGWGAERSGDK